MRGPGLSVGSVLGLALASVVSAAAFAGDVAQGEIARASTSPDERIGVNFFHNCRFSHEAPDDPIVSPGKPIRK